MARSSRENSVKLGPTLTLFTTGVGELNQFTVNSVMLDVKEPQSLMPTIFRSLVPELRLRGIYAYPHRSRLYFISSQGLDTAEKLVSSLCEALNELHEKVVKQVCGSGACLQYTCKDIAVENLNPVENISDFVIVRSIVYNYLKSMFYSNAVFSHLDNRGREGLTVYLKRLYECTDEDCVHTIVQGVRFFLEVTPKGRGRLWVDMVTRTREECFTDLTQRPRFLSHHEMKNRSLKMYHTYLREARLPPRRRCDKIDEYLRTLGIGDMIGLRYAILNPETRSMESRALVFIRVKPRFQPTFTSGNQSKPTLSSEEASRDRQGY